jgi:PAS domain S-box-containing protein
MVELLLVSRVVSVVSGAGLLALAAVTYRSREKPSASSFAVLLSILGVAALCGGATAHVGTPYKLVWLGTTLAIPLALTFFAFDYYGLPYFESRTRTLAAIVPAAAGAVGGTVLILATPQQSVGQTAPIDALAPLPPLVVDLAATANQVGLYYTTALILVAVALVLVTVSRYRHLDTRLGPVIAFIGVWPWLAYTIMPELSGVVAADILITGIASGYTGSVLAAAVAIGPLGLFDSTPAAGNVGPDTVLDSMSDAVVVADSEGHVLRLNAIACETFGTAPADAVGGPLAGVLSVALDELSAEETVTLDTTDGAREFDVTRSTITDRTGDERGVALVLRDVTRSRTREQRLAVLNRVLRHNLRNDATSIIGRAQLIGEGADPAMSERIVETTNGLVSTAERAREIQAMMTASSENETTSVAAVIDRVVSDVEADHPNVEITTALPSRATAAVAPTVFETTVRNVVENAAQHNDADEPIVVVSGDYDDGQFSLAVSDNGPGIPDHERAVLERGEESDLEHGSGLGLWAVYWGVTRMGGDLSFAENDPRGSIVTMTVPGESPPATVDGEQSATV